MEADTQRRREARIVEVENVLDDVVAERVLHQVEAISSDLANKLHLLEAGGMVDAALENAAAMTVRADGDAVLADSIKDELGVLGLEVVQALLDDVVAVQVLDKIDNLTAQGIDDHLDL